MEAQEAQMMESIRQTLERAAMALERITAVLESAAGANAEGEGFWKTVVGNVPVPPAGPAVGPEQRQ